VKPPRIFARVEELGSIYRLAIGGLDDGEPLVLAQDLDDSLLFSGMRSSLERRSVRLGRSNPVMMARILDASSRCDSRRTSGVAVAVSAIVGRRPRAPRGLLLTRNRWPEVVPLLLIQ